MNQVRADHNRLHSKEKGTFYTYSGTKGLSSQGRGPPTAEVLGMPGFSGIKTAILGEGGILKGSRAMPGDAGRAQDAHADGGDRHVVRMLVNAHTAPGQKSATLEFTMRADPAAHPRKADLAVDATTGETLRRVVEKGHGTVIMGDGVAFGREGSLIHEVKPAPSPGGGGTLTFLVDFGFPVGWSREKRLKGQRRIARRLAKIQENPDGTVTHATGLEIPSGADASASSLSATNSAHNNTVVELEDDTTTTKAAIQGDDIW